MDAAHLERGMFHRPGTLYARHHGLRRPRLLLFPESAAIRNADSEAADTAAVESRNPRVGHQLFRARHRPAGNLYSETQMENVDYTCRLRYFEKIADKYAVKLELKNLVQFDFHNSKTEFLPQRNDIIFCRNVMIYFDEQNKSA